MFTRRMRVPVPNEQTVVQLVPSPSDHAKKVAAYLVLLFPVERLWKPSKRMDPSLAESKCG